MNKISTVVFLVSAVAVLGAVGITTGLMSTHVAEAAGSGGQCHINKGSLACTGPGAKDAIGSTFVCNRHGCHETGP